MATRMIEIRGAKELIEKLKKLGIKNPAWLICKEATQEIVENMKARVPVWQGNLQKSIFAKPTKEGYEIEMNFYGRMVEEGHKISPSLARHPLLQAWARERYGAEEGMEWIAKVSRVGATAWPQPFIRPSVDEVTANLDNISISVLGKTIKEVGL
jgi:HK97 gp10 family phage protein